MLKRLLTWDGHDISSSSDIRGILPADGDYARSVSLAVTSRPGLSPTIDSFSLNVLDIPLVLARAANAGITTATFVQTVESWFPVGKRAILRGFAADGQTVVEVECVVSRAGMRPRRWVFDVVLTTESGGALGSSVSSGSSPSTVNNTGSQPVAPIIALTTGTHVSYRSITVSGAGAGGGLIAFPIRIDAGASAISGTKVYAYIQGVSVPLINNTRYVYVLVDTASDGIATTQIDLYYGASLPNNPLAGTLQDAGGDMAGNWETALMAWDDFGTVLSNPARPGAWRVGTFGNHHPSSASTYRVTTSGTTAICEIGAEGEFDNNGDSIVLVVGARAGTSNALARVRRVTANLDGTNARAFIRYRVAGSVTWQQAWVTRSNATVETSVDLDNAVEIAIGIENDGATNDPATLTISHDSGVGLDRANLTLAAAPTVTVGSAVNADYYNGAYTIGDYTITFHDVVCPDGTLTVDCAARTISTSGSGPIYGSFSFSDPDEWALLQPGGNTITDGLGATDTVSYRPAHG